MGVWWVLRLDVVLWVLGCWGGVGLWVGLGSPQFWKPNPCLVPVSISCFVSFFHEFANIRDNIFGTLIIRETFCCSSFEVGEPSIDP